MEFDELLTSRQIYMEKVSPQEIERALERAGRDLGTARKIMGEDRDWAFAIAYDAILQTSRAYMFARGFRPASNESHKNTFAFMCIAMGSNYEELISYFDRMRNKRHRAIYDITGLITRTEVYTILAKAEEFLMLIRAEIKKVNNANS